MNLFKFRATKRIEIPSDFIQDYNDEFVKINFKAAKVLSFAAFVIFPLFGFTGIDYIFAPEKYVFFLILRCIISIIILFFYCIFRKEENKKYAQTFSSIVLILLGAGIAIMIREIGYESPYYAGLNIVYLSAVMIPSNAKRTLFTCLSVYSFYLFPILIFDIDNIDLKIFINNNQFQIFTIIVASIVNYVKYNATKTEIINRLTIAKQADELKESEQAKKDFISSTTHDLKSPLSIIISHAEILENNLDEDSNTYKSAKFIHHSAYMLHKLIDLIITKSLLDKEDQPTLELFNYIEFITKIYQFFQNECTQKQLDYNISTNTTKNVVKIDETWVERIIVNLVKNAIKFTPKLGKICIKVFNDDKYIYTEVVDTGHGISSDKLLDIFKREYQTTEGKEHIGQGLGLSIVKDMLEKLGGDISVNSIEGEGTTFRFSLPLFVDQDAQVKNVEYTGAERRIQSDRRSMPRRSADKYELFKKEVEKEMTVTPFELNLEAYENKHPERTTLLIVEDTPGQIFLIIESLKNSFNLIFAKNGIEGLEKLMKFKDKISLIISDVKMPEMDGIEFCSKVFFQPIFKHIPFIFLTSYYSKEDEMRGHKIGATDYIKKPINPLILQIKINHWITIREHERILSKIIDEHSITIQEKTRLLDILRHEVRNPLQVLSVTNNSLIKLKKLLYESSNDEQKVLWDRMDRFSGGIETIKNVLESSKILQDNIEKSEMVDENIEEIVASVINLNFDLLEGIDVQMDVDKSGGLVIKCDRNLMKQVFTNLIKNAIEAIKENEIQEGKLCIHIGKNENSEWIVKIQDNGIGMDKDNIKKLFEFMHTTKRDGTGIGLYFTRKILQLHGGDITFNTEVKKGTTFTVLLPTYN